MPFFTYILISKSTTKLYIGSTSDLEDRLRRHNSNESISTKNKGPWELLFYKLFDTRSDAMQLEYKLKKWKNKIRVMSWIKREQSIIKE